MNAATRIAGAEAALAKGWWGGYRWLLLRRAVQLGILTLFLLGPWAGVWIVKGNLNASRTLDILPLADPYVLLQSVFAGRIPEATALIGALLVMAIYIVMGGRAYCAWVCPVNVVTDAAHWLRMRLGLSGSARLSRTFRYWLLGATLIVSAATGIIAWELVNPVSMLHRGLIFGMGSAWGVMLGVFVFDLLVSHRGWCGHLCPVGAFYSIIGKASVIRVGALDRARCNDCLDCLEVCPEPHIIKLPLRGAGQGAGPMILSPNCTNCGRCIDVCAQHVFRFATRFTAPTELHPFINKEIQQ